MRRRPRRSARWPRSGRSRRAPAARPAGAARAPSSSGQLSTTTVSAPAASTASATSSNVPYTGRPTPPSWSGGRQAPTTSSPWYRSRRSCRVMPMTASSCPTTITRRRHSPRAAGPVQPLAQREPQHQRRSRSPPAARPGRRTRARSADRARTSTTAAAGDQARPRRGAPAGTRRCRRTGTAARRPGVSASAPTSSDRQQQRTAAGSAGCTRSPSRRSAASNASAPGGQPDEQVEPTQGAHVPRSQRCRGRAAAGVPARRLARGRQRLGSRRRSGARRCGRTATGPPARRLTAPDRRRRRGGADARRGVAGRCAAGRAAADAAAVAARSAATPSPSRRHLSTCSTRRARCAYGDQRADGTASRRRHV